MKKVNFNALQNFEVPESWIENALNAKPKPKKKPFYLNARYLSAAACLVMVANAFPVVSTLKTNLNLTTPTAIIVQEIADSSTSENQEISTNNVIKDTHLPEATKEVETHKDNEATKTTEVPKNNEASNISIEPAETTQESGKQNKQHVITDQTKAPEDKTPVSENNHSEEQKETEPYEQPKTTEKPENYILPQESTAENKETEKIQESSNSEEEPVSTTPPKEYTITKTWDKKFSYSNDANSSVYYYSETETRLCYNGIFENSIIVSLPPGIWEKGTDITITCVITGTDTDDNTSGISGTFSYEYVDTVKSDNKITINSINIPCGYYDITSTLQVNDSGNNQTYENKSTEQLVDNDVTILLYDIGDANYDGTVDIRDVTSIQKYLAGMTEYNDAQLAAADTNGDGDVDIGDATRLQMYLAKYIVTLSKA